MRRRDATAGRRVPNLLTPDLRTMPERRAI